MRLRLAIPIILALAIPLFGGEFYGTFLGGAGEEDVAAVTRDASGYIYIAGTTDSDDFPTVNALQSYGGHEDAFITILSPDAKDILFSSPLGGSRDDGATALFVDDAGLITIACTTRSDEFLGTTTGADGENSQVILVVLEPLGAGLHRTTILGGSGDDDAYHVLVEGGKTIVDGFTQSVDFPLTPDALWSHIDLWQPYLTILNEDGTIDYSTFLPFVFDAGPMAVDGDTIWIAGDADNTTFPVTPDAVQPTIEDEVSILCSGLIRIRPHDLNGLLYASFMGGSSADIYDMKMDDEGKLHIAGVTRRTDFPVTANAYDVTFGVGNEYSDYRYKTADGFYLIYDTIANTIPYATYLGGRSWDQANSLELLEGGKVLISGVTDSPDFPVTPDAYQSRMSGMGSEDFIFLLDPAQAGSNALEYGSYLGGFLYNGWGRRKSFPYQGGYLSVLPTLSSDMPVSPDALDRLFGDGTIANSASTDIYVAETFPRTPQTEETLYFAGAASAPGAYLSHWQSSLFLYNPYDDPLSVTVTFIPREGDETTTSSRTITIEPHRPHQWDDVVAEVSGVEGAGVVKVVTPEGAPIPGFMRTFNRMEGGTYGQGIPPMTFARGRGIFGLLHGPDFRHNLGLVNPNDHPITVQVTLHTPDGTWSKPQRVAARHNMQINDVMAFLGAHEEDPWSYEYCGDHNTWSGNHDLDDDTYGTLDCQDTYGYYVSSVENISGDPFYFSRDIVYIGSGALYYGVTHAEGSHGSTWRSDFNILNPIDSNGWVGFTFGDVTSDYACVPPISNVYVKDVLTSFLDEDDITGVVYPRWSFDFGRTYTEGDNGTFGQRQPAYGNDFFLPDQEVLFPFAIGNEEYRCNIIILNGKLSNFFTITLYDLDGNVVGTRVKSSAPESYIQWNDIFNTLGFPPTKGYLSIVGRNEWHGILSLVDNGTNDPTTIDGLPLPLAK